jgi:membrane-associated phospholipid phosphatase
VRAAAIVLGCAGFAALAGLVAAGALTGFDQWAIGHAMPGLSLHYEPVTPRSVLVPFSGPRSPLSDAGDAMTLPASLVPSLLIVGSCVVVLWRRGRRASAIAWTAAWIAGNAVEALCKLVLARPRLVAHTAHGAAHLRGFDHSFPSGHTIRSLLGASAVVAVLPVARWLAATWVAASLSFLIAAGFHTPSDVLGGCALALVLVAAATALQPRKSRNAPCGGAPSASAASR